MLHEDDQTPLWIDHLPTEPHDITAAFPKQNPYCHGAICFRRAAAEQIGGYREEFNTSQDYDFLWRLSERFGGANLPQVLYHRRFTPSSISTNRALDQARNRALARRLGAMRAAINRKTSPKPCKKISADLQRKIFPHSRHRAIICSSQATTLPALKKYLHAILRTPWRRLPYLKTFRWALYMLAPRLRPRLFGHRDPERQQPIAKTQLAPIAMQNFVDIHCHLLPAVDDGAKDLAESLAMARLAVAEGIRAIVATPHQLGGSTLDGDFIRQQTALLQQQLEAAEIPLQIYPGADVRVEPDLLKQINQGTVLTLADRRKHVLLELPHELLSPHRPAPEGITRPSSARNPLTSGTERRTHGKPQAAV